MRCKQLKINRHAVKHPHPFNVIASRVSPALQGTLDRFVRRFFFPMRRGRRIGLPDDAIVKSSFVSRIGLRNSALGLYVHMHQPCASASRAMRHDQDRI